MGVAEITAQNVSELMKGISILYYQEVQMKTVKRTDILSHYFFVSRSLIEMFDVNLILLYSPSFFLETLKVVSLFDPTFCYKCV